MPMMIPGPATTTNHGTATPAQVVQQIATAAAVAAVQSTITTMSGAYIEKALGTAKGSLVGFSASGTPVEIPKFGQQNSILMTDSAQASGLVYGFGLGTRVYSGSPGAAVTAVDISSLSMTAAIMVMSIANPTGNPNGLYLYANGDYTDTNYYHDANHAYAEANYPQIGGLDNGTNGFFVGYLWSVESVFRAMLFSNVVAGGSLVSDVYAIEKRTGSVASITDVRILSTEANGIASTTQIDIYEVATG